MLGWPGEPAPCTKRKERATPQRQRQRTGVSALHNLWWLGAQRSFSLWWDSTVVSRVGLLGDSCSGLVQRVNDDPHYPSLRLRLGQALFAKCAKRMGQLAESATKLAFPAKYCSLAGNS